MTISTRSRSGDKIKKQTKKTIAKQPKTSPKDKLKAIKANSEQDVLEVCLMLDCTASMCSWIQRSKDTLKGIIKNIQHEHKNLTVRVSFVGYRDIGDHDRFSVHDFSQDLDAITKIIAI